MIHSESTLKYFYDLQHAGKLDAANNVMIAEQGSEALGDVIKLYTMLENNVIKKARFQCYGQVTTIAGAEFLCRWLTGKTTAQASALKADLILKALDLSNLHNHVAWRLLDCIKTLETASKSSRSSSAP